MTLSTASLKDVKKTQFTSVRCPNCGRPGERHAIDRLVRTQCQHCDYLLVTCAETGNVVEAYSPGLYASTLS